MLELKDKLDLVFKFLFLAVFTYGVITFSTCMTNCKTQCSTDSQPKCCKSNVATEKPCGSK